MESDSDVEKSISASGEEDFLGRLSNAVFFFTKIYEKEKQNRRDQLLELRRVWFRFDSHERSRIGLFMSKASVSTSF